MKHPEGKQLVSEYLSAHDCHPDSMQRLEIYVELLTKWSSTYNLIGPNELPSLWSRHILDSAQLIQYIPKNDQALKIVDLGSGAGFPGVVLSFLREENFYLVEKSYKKAIFLETVARETGVSFSVLNSRIEEIQQTICEADIVTARALSDFNSLLRYSKDLLTQNGYTLFLKGKHVDLEIKNARKNFAFDCDLYDGITDETNKIAKVSHIKSLPLA